MDSWEWSRRAILEHGSTLVTVVTSENGKGHRPRTVLVLVTESYHGVRHDVRWYKYGGDSSEIRLIVRQNVCVVCWLYTFACSLCWWHLC